MQQVVDSPTAIRDVSNVKSAACNSPSLNKQFISLLIYADKNMVQLKLSMLAAPEFVHLR